MRENNMIQDILSLQHQLTSMQYELLEKTKEMRSHFQSLTDLVLIHLDYDTHGTLYNVCPPIGSTGARMVADALQGNQKLVNVELGFNEIGNQGLVSIGTVLSSTKIEELDLVYSGFDAQGIRDFCPFLVRTTLKTLVLSRNEIRDEGVELLLDALMSSRIETLGLDKTGIGTRGIQCVARFVSTHPCLRGLDLSLNNITGDGIRYLSKALFLTRKLMDLDLHGNEIHDEDAVLLAHALQHNRTLRSLNLCDNALERRGAFVLAEALSHNHTLAELRLDENNFDNEGIQCLVQLVQQNSGLVIHAFEQEIQEWAQHNQEWIHTASQKATQLVTLARNLILVSLPTEIKHVILEPYSSVVSCIDEWHVVRGCLLERRLIGIHDDHPFDCKSLLRLCHYLLKYCIY
jgi:Ran GTPase-activating protein (RanGAP) involved in mRNA processing and transport